MLRLVHNKPKPQSLSETIGSNVSACIFEALSAKEGSLYSFDRWTRRKITLGNMAKMELVLSADDPVEYCYQNLIREIDAEAEFGIYLVNDAIIAPDLQSMQDEPGISGELHADMDKIAHKFRRDGLIDPADGLDLAWETILKRYARARVDTAVSEVMMSFLMDSAEIAGDMSHAIRVLMYSFREDEVRHECGLPPMVSERGSRELALMVSEHRKRAGGYATRGRDIRTERETA